MSNYNKSGPGHPPVHAFRDPVAVDMLREALREAIAELDRVRIHATMSPIYKELYHQHQEHVILLARVIAR
jgi:hypothetical protein